MTVLLGVSRAMRSLRVGAANGLPNTFRCNPPRAFKVGFPADSRLPWVFLGIPKQDLANAVTPVNFILLSAQQARISEKVLTVVVRNNIRPFCPICDYRVANGSRLRLFEKFRRIRPRLMFRFDGVQ